MSTSVRRVILANQDSDPLFENVIFISFDSWPNMEEHANVAV